MPRLRLAGLAGLLLVVGACATGTGDDAAPATAPSAAPTGPGEPSSSTPTEAAPPRLEPDPLVEEVEEQLRRQAEGKQPLPTGDDEPILGADASWPQCPKGMGIPQKRSNGSPAPLAEARYVILGLTNGPGFYPNPCLADQVAQARAQSQLLGAYAVASYPEARFLEQYADDGPFEGGSRLDGLANVGYQQARFNVREMRRAGLDDVPVVWIDVEPVPDFSWSTDLEANAAVIRGVARGYTDAGLDIGVYSTPLLWDGVVGDLELGLPEWRAAGQASREEALSRCGDDWVVQGGPAVIAQWVEDGRDQNVTCPGTSLEMSRWFAA